MGVDALALATVVAGAARPRTRNRPPTSQRADIPARREVGASGVQAHSLGRGTSGEPEALADLDENILARSFAGSVPVAGPNLARPGPWWELWYNPYYG